MKSVRWMGVLSLMLIAWNPVAMGGAIGGAMGGEVKQDSQEVRGPWVVGSTLLNPMTVGIFNRVQQLTPSVPPPRIENHNLALDVHEFCHGTGIDTPDILALSRRMGGAEFEQCARNGVTDIIEMQIGVEALVLVTLRQNVGFPLTFDTLFRAIAAELPDVDDSGDDFHINSAHTWRDVNPKLPATDIHVVIPSKATFVRSFFDARFLQGACREITEYKNIFSADERVAMCTNLRKDGTVIELGMPYTSASVIEALEKAPRGTIAMLSLRYALEAANKIEMLPLEGVSPNRETIGDLSYPAIRRLRYYVKRAHIKDYNGNGPVVGLREFITEATRESAIGENGYLLPLGLVPLPQKNRADTRRSALALTPMER